MMDISHIVRGPIVEGQGPKIESQPKQNDSGDEPVDDEKSRQGDRYRNLKRSLDEDLINSKKRRKQLKPIRIATNLEDMVQVPKQIIGLNNDLDNINDMSHAVPKETSSKPDKSPSNTVNDVHVANDNRLPLETSSDQKSHDSNSSIDNYSRDIDKSEITELNVPSIETGPNYITNPNFMFPFSFQPMKNPHYWSDRNLKIFNHEAYCELCKKEFCNKYFLKTHKANKHGIYVDFPSASSASSASASAASAVSAATAAKPKPEISGNPSSKISENGKSLGESDCERAFCDLCNKRFCNKYFVRRHKTKSHGLIDDDSQYGIASFMCQDAELNIVQNHSTKDSLTSFEPLALLAKENDNHEPKKADEQESPLNLIVNVKESDDDEQEEEEKEEKPKEAEVKTADDADECSSENIEKLQTMLLRLNPSEIENKLCKVCNELIDGSGEHKCGYERKEEYLSEANDSSNESKNEMPLLKNDSADFLFVNRLEHLKQMKPTSSYCEICNKELCNKYFMRTHMQRMHGIEIEHGTQIGGVVCNICNKELCSKYFLRVHKQNTHGIVSPNSMVTPSTSATVAPQRVDVKPSRGDARFTSGVSQVCYICNKRFRSPKWLQAHFLSDHREESERSAIKEEGDEEEREEKEKEEDVVTIKIPKKNPLVPEIGADPPEALDVISKLFWENNSLSKSYNCSQCSFSTSVLAFLFVHERSHFVLAQDSSELVKPSASLQNLIHDKTFWQHKITQQVSECLDLSSGKAKYLSFEQNGS